MKFQSVNTNSLLFFNSVALFVNEIFKSIKEIYIIILLLEVCNAEAYFKKNTSNKSSSIRTSYEYMYFHISHYSMVRTYYY